MASLPTHLVDRFPSMKLARTPKLARRLAWLLLFGLIAAPFGLALIPWTQSVHGHGRAIAFNPVQRPQFIVSPIEGRIKKWHVVEGQRVKAGQRIVEMVDNDPHLELRLLDEERAILDRLRAAEGRVGEIQARIRNIENSRDLAISVQQAILRQEKARVQVAEEELVEADTTVKAAEPNYQRVKGLFESPKGGLASQRDVELAKQQLDAANAKRRQADAKVKQAKAGETAANENLHKVDADTRAMINLENASILTAKADVASVQRDKAQIETRIARQRAQYVDASVDGIVFQLLANAEQGGILVRPGERLAILVPDIKDTDLTPDGEPGIVVELNIDGNDLPLIRKGDRVRVQFEGWPAVQFVGWPSVSVGTFGARVYLIDPTTNDKGQFRILVEPDPDSPAWPDQEFLRQGVRAQGWILLNEVTLGWETWRQINGFPPVRETQKKTPSRSLGPVQ